MAKRTGTVGTFPEAKDDKRPRLEILRSEISRKTKYSIDKVFDPYRDTKIIWDNRHLVWNSQFQGSNGTIKCRIPLLRVVNDFFIYLEEKHSLKISSVNELDIGISTAFLPFIEHAKQRSPKTKFYRNFLRAIGVPGDQLPLNVYRDSRVTQPIQYDESRTRRAVKALKAECNVVIQRTKTRDNYLRVGSDPRLGQNDSWEKPENGLFVSTRIVGLSLRSWEEMNLSGEIVGFRDIMRGLNRCPGAPYTRADGTVGAENGWTGQARWFYPYADDIAPFVILTMIRTAVNFSAIARVKHGVSNWSEPYPFTVGSGAADQYVFMLFEKDRGRDPNDRDVGPNMRIISSTRPYSHPYRIFQFIEELTAPLRAEMQTEIARLSNRAGRSALENKQLEKLVRIKDDLFIYRTKTSRFSSLSEYADVGIPYAVSKCLLRAGLETNIRNLRSLKINFAFVHSGGNLFVAQLLAHHRSSETSVLYVRRKATLARHYELFENIFAFSVSLIRSKKLSYQALRAMLEAQGFAGTSLDNLMNPKLKTAWGNNCATPYAPPQGFDVGTAPGQMCRAQNCINGCPSARWFYDAFEIIKRQHSTLCLKRSSVGLLSIEGSSLPQQIENLEKLMSEWDSLEQRDVA